MTNNSYTKKIFYNNPLMDKDFLYELDQINHREIYAKIISLDINENPIEQIEGRVTAGSINIDGKSALRRTCSLSLVSKNVNINDFYWGLTNKFRLLIGLKNLINPNYPDIIWFKQGTYVITSFNTSISVNNATINISGKDKMCFLNGDFGGALPSSVDFGSIESYDVIYNEMIFNDPKAQYKAHEYYVFLKKDEVTGKDIYVLSDEEYDSKKTYYKKEDISHIEKIPLRTILREAVHTYAKEPYHNIVINDLEDSGLELLEYRGDEDHPLYVIKTSGEPVENSEGYPMPDGDLNIVPNGKIKIRKKGSSEIIFLEDLKEEEYDTSIKEFNNGVEFSLVTGHPDQYYTAVRLRFGDTAGYRLTDLTYPNDLISNIGENLTSMLDKIKNLLGDFEYFYDVDGRFIFQKKKTYINTTWNNLVNTDDDIYAESSSRTSSFIYSFENNNLITSFQNNPALNNLRNDFSVWGHRTTSTGVEIPIHARYAIDKKPIYYKSIKNGNVYISDLEQNDWLSDDDIEKNPNILIRDWRELIYQMAADYLQYNQDVTFLNQIIKNNTIVKKNAETDEYELYCFYPTGLTGYEFYYTDIQGFWRQLYNPEAEKEYSFTGGRYETVREIVDEETGTFKEVEKWIDIDWSEEGTCDYYIDVEDDDPKLFWNKNVIECPELLNFWFDFLDNGDLQQFSVKAIGNRPKSINDKDITSIYFRETPNIIYTKYEDYNEEDIKSGYSYVFTPNGFDNMFSISAQGKSAKDAIDEMIYNHAYCIENISITAIPVYYLEPNTRIYVHDDESSINGEYLIEKITIPLTYNGTMSISATKAVERLY